jgi:hypothetical protein
LFQVGELNGELGDALVLLRQLILQLVDASAQASRHHP